VTSANCLNMSLSNGCRWPTMTSECRGGPRSVSIISDRVDTIKHWLSQPTLATPTQTLSSLNTVKNITMHCICTTYPLTIVFIWTWMTSKLTYNLWKASRLNYNPPTTFIHVHVQLTYPIIRYPPVCMCVCVFVWLRISPARIKLAMWNFARWFIGILDRESPIFGKFAPQKPKIGQIGA